MAKVEIELNELTSLKNELIDAQRQINYLNIELIKLSNSELKEKYVDLSKKLSTHYLNKIFQELGFDNKIDTYSIEYKHSELYSLGKYEDWYQSAEIKVELCAEIIDNFKKAYIKIGVDPSKKK